EELQGLAKAARDDGFKELFLRPEEPEDVRLRDAGLGCDRLCRRAAQPVERELLESGIENSFASLLGCLPLGRDCHHSRKLLLTYKRVKRFADAVDLALAQPAVQRESQRPVEACIGIRKRALVAEGRQAVDGIGPDLRLDSLPAQAGE